MGFKLSQRSLSRLEGVHPDMVAVVERAIEITDVDFGVTQGVRTLAQQKEYVRIGKSQTMNSKHLPQSDGYSHAVDVVAYVDGDVAWELNLYDNIADAFKQAAEEQGVSVKWGAAWNVTDITKWDGTMEEAMMHYVDTRRKEKKRPFIDGPHFELS
jgi:peptidoglycan L-alanyl-D-glutamate endopeptidase CwlK